MRKGKRPLRKPDFWRRFLYSAIILVVVNGTYGQDLLPTHYRAVLIRPVSARSGINIPPEYLTRIVDSLADYLKTLDKVPRVFRPGEQSTAALEISTVVTGFEPGSWAKRIFIGLGQGATSIQAHVTLTEGTTRRVVGEKDVSGKTFLIEDRSIFAADYLANSIADFAKTGH